MRVNKVGVVIRLGNVCIIINDTHLLRLPFQGAHMADTLRSLAVEVERISMLPEQELILECETNAIDELARKDQADREYIAGICL